MSEISSSRPRLYDSHVHLQDERLLPFAPTIASTLEAENVAASVVNGTQEQDWPAVLQWARRDRRVIPSFGLHPWHVPYRSPHWQTQLLEYLDLVPSAVGEIGLDRWVKGHNLPDQQEVFLQQLQLATRRNLPLSIHCLRAWGRLLSLLQQEALPACGFLLHSFSGPPEMIGPLAELGGYFSISGHFAQDRKSVQQEAFRRVPKERLLIETDAPDMLPPERIIRYPLVDKPTNKPLNHPGNLGLIYRFVAELCGQTVEDLALQIEENFFRLFGSLRQH